MDDPKISAVSGSGIVENLPGLGQARNEGNVRGGQENQQTAARLGGAPATADAGSLGTVRLEGIVQNFFDGLSKIGGAINGAIDKAGEKLKGLLEALQGKVDNIRRQVLTKWQGLKAWAGDIKDSATEVKNGIVDNIKEAVQKLGEAVKGFGEGVANLISSFSARDKQIAEDVTALFEQSSVQMQEGVVGAAQ
jgi:hypothetical protein